MSDYDNTDTGVLFKNERKKSDKHPDYTGSINIGGTEYWLSAWIKEGKKGKFMSLAIGDEKEARHERTNPRQRDEIDDDIPF